MQNKTKIEYLPGAYDMVSSDTTSQAPFSGALSKINKE